MIKKAKIDSFVILLIFAAIYPILPHYFTIYGVRVADIFLCFTFLILIIFNNGIITVKKNIRWFVVPLIIWTVVTVLIEFYHGEKQYPLRQLVLWFGICFVGYQIIDSKEKFLKIIDIIIFVAFVIACFGFIEEFTGFNIFNLINTEGVELNYNPPRFGILRIISFTSHAITYGAYCLFILSLIFYRITTLSGRATYIYKIAYIFVSANAFLTLSRSSLIVIVCAQFLLLFFCGHTSFIKRILQIILIMGIILIFGAAISEQFRNAILVGVYTVMALFNDYFLNALRSIGFNDNPGGVGDRFSLYAWVWDALSPNYLLGQGRQVFNYSYINSAGYFAAKSSIEVEWLRTLYYNGIIGMIAEIFAYIVLLVKTWGKKYLKASFWEKKLNFVRMMGVLLLGYIMLLFAVMQNEEEQIFAVCILLLLAYISHNGFNEEKVR